MDLKSCSFAYEIVFSLELICLRIDAYFVNTENSTKIKKKRLPSLTY